MTSKTPFGATSLALTLVLAEF